MNDVATPIEAPVLIEAKGVEVAFGGHTVLSGGDVSVRAGEIVTLIGPNGAGKTTLVRVMLGLIKPSVGTVTRKKACRSVTCRNAYPSIRRCPSLSNGSWPWARHVVCTRTISSLCWMTLARAMSPTNPCRAFPAARCSACCWRVRCCANPIFWSWTSPFKVSI